MTTNFLENDKAVEALLEELKTLKSSSQQLQDAGRTVTQVVQSAEKVTGLSAQVMDNGAKQLDAVAKLSAETEQRLDAAIAAQKTFADQMDDFLRSGLRPQMAKYQRSASFNRWLLFLLILLSLANLALTIWLNQGRFIQ
jgi:hypothetical protein